MRLINSPANNIQIATSSLETGRFRCTLASHFREITLYRKIHVPYTPAIRQTHSDYDCKTEAKMSSPDLVISIQKPHDLHSLLHSYKTRLTRITPYAGRTIYQLINVLFLARAADSCA
ncbi:hypothetical protein HOLleu_38051 [Holothuria leucospilota]|uniref:Uncharacterized protein n=1 Tax=Holothuria leucospilota TaxID=206669 RepID=A0A9Q1BFS4_HOLLE|nr:hypothetical protein HOLleu_38051 [Holothuria leucospilota]